MSDKYVHSQLYFILDQGDIKVETRTILCANKNVREHKHNKSEKLSRNKRAIKATS